MREFNGLEYIASYADLRLTIGADKVAGTAHYLTYGIAEHRTVTFSALDYIASYDELITAFGASVDAGAAHYITYGVQEERTVSFDGLQYIASSRDLIEAIGADASQGARHFIEHGRQEGRQADGFDAHQYLLNYSDLQAAFGNDEEAATAHYITYGYHEQRTDQAPRQTAYFTTGLIDKQLWRLDDMGRIEATGLHDVGSLLQRGSKVYFYGDNGSKQGLWEADSAGGVNFLGGDTLVNESLKLRVEIGFQGSDIYSTYSADGTLVKLDHQGNFVPVGFQNVVLETEYNGELYFRQIDRLHGSSLWKIDRGGNGVFVAEVEPIGNTGNFAICNGSLFFSGIEGEDLYGYRIGLDGAITRLDNSDARDPLYFFGYNDDTFFTAEGVDVGRELWHLSNGAPELVQDLNMGADSSDIDGLVEFDGDLYFTAFTSTNGVEIFRYNPASGVVPAAINVDAQFLDISRETLLFDEELYFVAFTKESRNQIWKIDKDGVIMQISNLDAGETLGADEFSLFEYNENAYFRFPDRGNHFGLFRIEKDDTISHIDSANDGTFLVDVSDLAAASSVPDM